MSVFGVLLYYSLIRNFQLSLFWKVNYTYYWKKTIFQSLVSLVLTLTFHEFFQKLDKNGPILVSYSDHLLKKSDYILGWSNFFLKQGTYILHHDLLYLRYRVIQNLRPHREKVRYDLELIWPEWLKILLI